MRTNEMSKQNEVTRTWADLNENIMGLTEDECWKLLAAEKKGERRLQVMMRLYGRANKLRGERERRELAQVNATIN